jgi:hypothetical protein
MQKLQANCQRNLLEILFLQDAILSFGRYPVLAHSYTYLRLRDVLTSIRLQRTPRVRRSLNSAKAIRHCNTL